MNNTKTETIFKIKNKTDQPFQLINNGYLLAYQEIRVTEVTDQMKNLEKMGLLKIREG